MKILIYDDVEGFRGKVREHIEGLPFMRDAFEIETPDERALKDSMMTLEDRRRKFRKTGTWDGERVALDDVSVFVVDFDLFEAVPFLNGETVAYLARCFSSCGLIVGYRYGDNSFDLTLRGVLREELGSFTDLYVGGTQLGNPGLWEVTGAAESEFRPWHWPVLPDYLRDFEKKVEGVKESLDVPICQVLGLAFEMFDMLPRSISQFLGDKPSETTFRQFVTKSGNGLERRDVPKAVDMSEDALARVGAARISKWLERLVLPEQDILVDAPHLVSRYPSLMTDDVTNIETWNRAARLTSHEKLGLTTDLIESFRLKKAHWLSRPVWFWDELRECENILEVREPWEIRRPNWVFCEDASQFYEEGYREFVADVESPFARRFVKDFEGVDYRPKVRFSL
ncbi:MAG: hypothetical protein DDT32_00736 [Syntrophomonadaceae bacterium]|nr:hypothetical protein [Bacillota bacterium]MBT9146985.1 hypothetical protein [Bacillota bacterium]